MLLKERLQSGYLSVDVGNVLFNNVGQFLDEGRRKQCNRGMCWRGHVH